MSRPKQAIPTYRLHKARRCGKVVFGRTTVCFPGGYNAPNRWKPTTTPLRSGSLLDSITRPHVDCRGGTAPAPAGAPAWVETALAELPSSYSVREISAVSTAYRAVKNEPFVQAIAGCSIGGVACPVCRANERAAGFPRRLRTTPIRRMRVARNRDRVIHIYAERGNIGSVHPERQRHLPNAVRWQKRRTHRAIRSSTVRRHRVPVALGRGRSRPTFPILLTPGQSLFANPIQVHCQCRKRPSSGPISRRRRQRMGLGLVVGRHFRRGVDQFPPCTGYCTSVPWARGCED